MPVKADLPDDPAPLRAMPVTTRGGIVQQQAHIADLEGASTDARAEIERLTPVMAAFQRHGFGARSDQLHPDPLALALDENTLVAGSDRVGDHWAVIASLIETCKLNPIDPQAWLSATLSRLVAGHAQNRLDELMP